MQMFSMSKDTMTSTSSSPWTRKGLKSCAA
jgi:hypothetical protein